MSTGPRLWSPRWACGPCKDSGDNQQVVSATVPLFPTPSPLQNKAWETPNSQVSSYHLPVGAGYLGSSHPETSQIGHLPKPDQQV